MRLVSLLREDGSIGKEAKLKTAVQLQDFLDVVVVVNAVFAGTCSLRFSENMHALEGFGHKTVKADHI